MSCRRFLRRGQISHENRPFAFGSGTAAVAGQTGRRVNVAWAAAVLGACLNYAQQSRVGRLPFSLSSQRKGVWSFSNTRFMALKNSLAVTFF